MTYFIRALITLVGAITIPQFAYAAVDTVEMQFDGGQSVVVGVDNQELTMTVQFTWVGDPFQVTMDLTSFNKTHTRIALYRWHALRVDSLSAYGPRYQTTFILPTHPAAYMVMTRLNSATGQIMRMSLALPHGAKTFDIPMNDVNNWELEYGLNRWLDMLQF
ncbi:MAG: hypothetical protein MJA83_16735 [Gammaproteobacteria bacterium]|nr:hypothetical protein [Gammaproteobacteria bacterium]